MGSLTDFVYLGGDYGRGWLVAGLVFRALLAAFFVFLAWKNLSGDPQMAADFSRWGYPDWFRPATAVVQILGACLLVPTATCFLGGLILAGVLAGALMTHILHDPLGASASPAVFLALVVASTAWFRPPILLQLLQ